MADHCIAEIDITSEAMRTGLGVNVVEAFNELHRDNDEDDPDESTALDIILDECQFAIRKGVDGPMFILRQMVSDTADNVRCGFRNGLTDVATYVIDVQSRTLVDRFFRSECTINMTADEVILLGQKIRELP